MYSCHAFSLHDCGIQEKKKKNWGYIQFLGGVSLELCLFLGGAVSSFQPFSIYKCKVMSLSNHFSLRVLSPLSERAAIVVNPQERDFRWRWVCGLEAACQSASLSVSQQVFIYLSGCSAAY